MIFTAAHVLKESDPNNRNQFVLSADVHCPGGPAQGIQVFPQDMWISDEFMNDAPNA